MAVDTAAKRFSMVSVGGETFGLRVPDATDMDDKGDRANELFLYFGLEPGDPVPPPSGSLFGDRRRRAVISLRWFLGGRVMGAPVRLG